MRFWRALGDAIARMPAVKYILDYHQHIGVHLWVPDFFLPLAKRMFPKNSRIVIRSYMAEPEKYKQDQFSRIFSTHKHTNLAYHMTDHAFNILCNKQIADNNLKNCLTLDLSDVKTDHFSLPDKYVVIPPNYTSPVRKLKGNIFNQIKDYVTSKGYAVVVLGNEQMVASKNDVVVASAEVECDYTNTIDLRNKTTLLEAAQIMKGAKFVVGLDNGLLHLAASTGNVPLVYGFTSVLPETRLPYRNGILGDNCYVVALTEKELACIGCQSNMVFTFAKGEKRNDFRECFYSDALCLDMLGFEKYKEQIDKLI